MNKKIEEIKTELDNEEFYNIMQAYRHTSVMAQANTTDRYESVKTYIAEFILENYFNKESEGDMMNKGIKEIKERLHTKVYETGEESIWEDLVTAIAECERLEKEKIQLQQRVNTLENANEIWINEIEDLKKVVASAEEAINTFSVSGNHRTGYIDAQKARNLQQAIGLEDPFAPTHTQNEVDEHQAKMEAWGDIHTASPLVAKFFNILPAINHDDRLKTMLINTAILCRDARLELTQQYINMNKELKANGGKE